MTKFLSISSVVAAVAAGLFVVAAGAHAETRDHRGQPKQFAPPKTCTYYCPPGAIRVPNCAYNINNPKCRDHRK